MGKYLGNVIPGNCRSQKYRLLITLVEKNTLVTVYRRDKPLVTVYRRDKPLVTVYRRDKDTRAKMIWFFGKGVGGSLKLQF